MNKLYVIGAGPGDEQLLTGIAKETLSRAQRVLNTREMPLAELMSELKYSEKGGTAVLVSGDCGFFSVAKTILRDFSGFYEIEVLPGISSIQYLSAKLKVPYDDAAKFSLHGRSGFIVPKVAYNKRVFVLTDNTSSVREICSTLYKYGLGHVDVSVGERLSYPDERVVSDKAEVLKDMDFDGLSVMYIENPSATDPQTPLLDKDFIRGDIPMTKEEIRWLSVRKLGIRPGDTVYDVGAGTGSVSVEMARSAYDGFVYAIEAKEDACALVRENASRFGAFNIEIIHGEAPLALDGLPVPDKAFIGGSAGNMDGILAKLTSLNPDIRLVANAITLQTLNQLTEGFEKYGISGTETICVNIAKSRKTGEYDMMVAQNPVYIVSGGR